MAATMIQTTRSNEPLPISPEQVLDEHRRTWNGFTRVVILTAAAIAVLLILMRLFLV
jgi:hypothetical protein